MFFIRKFLDYFKIFSDRKLLAFMGSGLIVSVAYMDPGNWGTDISGGALFNYDLLWVVWLASGMAMLFVNIPPVSSNNSTNEVIEIKIFKSFCRLSLDAMQISLRYWLINIIVFREFTCFWQHQFWGNTHLLHILNKLESL